MFLHYGITHAPFALLAGVSLIAFAAGLLLGVSLDEESGTITVSADATELEQ